MSFRFALAAALLACLGLAWGAGAPAARAQVQTRPLPSDAEKVSAWVDDELPALLSTYRHLHAHPELSLEESETAAWVARALERAGYEVTIRVGGHGVVGMMRNGEGPTLLIRGDMDGLPVVEETGLEYASEVLVERPDGTEVGVMHACGHDVHVTSLLGTARLLAALKTQWRGTLMIVAQPAEEVGKGALMMIEDGLFERFARPDYTLALHVDAGLEAGKIGYVSGWTAANVDSVDIEIRGRGGHGARPHSTIDPIVTAAHLITALQTLVSRRVDPIKPAVVTVGSIHGGSKHNVIPDSVRLQLTVRSYSDDVRNQLLDGIRQLADDTCRTFQCPEPPIVTFNDEYTPAAYNDPTLTAAAVEIFKGAIGDANVVAMPAAMGGEDFGRYARHLEVPGLLFRLGSIDPKTMAESRAGGAPLPSLHSSLYAPEPEATLRTGVSGMAQLALSLLGRP